jgi:multicomponent K+:H+ antiporter subunit C
VELLFASAIGVLVASGVYLLLRARTFPVVLGLALISYAVNYFVFAMGRLKIGLEPIISESAVAYPDPLPQALVLTAIVIGFAMTAFVLVLSLRSNTELGTDHVDGRPGQFGDDVRYGPDATLSNNPTGLRAEDGDRAGGEAGA